MSADDGLAWALRYAAASLLIFPVNANNTKARRARLGLGISESARV